jgi:hypothetical protein
MHANHMSGVAQSTWPDNVPVPWPEPKIIK